MELITPQNTRGDATQNTFISPTSAMRQVCEAASMDGQVECL